MLNSVTAQYVQKPTFYASNQVEVNGRFFTKKDVCGSMFCFLIFPVVVVIM